MALRNAANPSPDTQQAGRHTADGHNLITKLAQKPINVPDYRFVPV
jgi:hypothetical protein